jgi:hypothetical protein
MRDYLPEEYVDEIVASTGAYPVRIKEQRFDITVRNRGPFPLRHADFLLVDDEFNVLSIMDWENVGTIPWERVEFSDWVHQNLLYHDGCIVHRFACSLHPS